jgi:hypothetical protein
MGSISAANANVWELLAFGADITVGLRYIGKPLDAVRPFCFFAAFSLIGMYVVMARSCSQWSKQLLRGFGAIAIPTLTRYPKLGKGPKPPIKDTCPISLSSEENLQRT